MSLAERDADLQEVRGRLATADAAAEERALLIRKLEDDLLRGSKPACTDMLCFFNFCLCACACVRPAGCLY